MVVPLFGQDRAILNQGKCGLNLLPRRTIVAIYLLVAALRSAGEPSWLTAPRSVGSVGAESDGMEAVLRSRCGKVGSILRGGGGAGVIAG